ncbi:glycoside hydrolase family 16 protein [Kineococcus terrestris]|uniref:glycoside hydrolase family 16 protein n=1 Tax=Kineococcus terrestris TaxID=2044856 RepID=UPI0034DAF32B
MRRRRAVTALLAAVAVLAGGAAPAEAAVSYSAVTAVAVSGTSATATTVVTTDAPVLASRLGVCARDAQGRNLDFPKVSNVLLTSRSTRVVKSRTFAPGTYSAFTCALIAGSWRTIGSVRWFTVPSTTTATTPSTSSSATSMPVGDLPGWRQVFADDFTTPVPVGSFPGTVYGAKWEGYDGLLDTSNKGTYTPGKVLSVRDGALRWDMHTENGRPLVAAPVPKLPTYGQTYGRYSLRFRTSATPGYKIAFLLWPDDDDWNKGELDWPEVGALGDRPSPASLVAGSLTGGTPPTFLPVTRAYAPDDTSDWHVATTEWTPGRVTFLWDGVPVATVTRGVPTTSMHWVLQAETTVDGPLPDPAAVGRVEVDWAVAYRYAP